jgi:hypothetical protein
MKAGNVRLFGAEQIRLILETQSPHKRIAEQLGCSAWTIAMVRFGDRYSDVLPEIPRWERQPSTRSTAHPVNCWNCIHGRSTTVRNANNTGSKNVVRCGLGLPDPIEEGARFARFCAAFVSTAAETQTELDQLEVVA